LKYPKLRLDLQAVPVVIEGRSCVAFHDPLGLAGESFAVDRQLLPFLQLLNGRNDLRDLQMTLMRRQGGKIIPLAEIEKFLVELDRNGLLESERFRQEMSSLKEAYRRKENREPVHAGRSYSDDKEVLRRFIDDTEKALPPVSPESSGKAVSGAIAPHIDISVAAPVYVDLYRRLRGGSYDVVFILGINHREQDGLYSVSSKHYGTPFGDLKTDREFVTRLSHSVPPGTLASDDFGHRTEHSIEFQAVFLRHYLGPETPVVPVLCGGIHEFLMTGRDMTTDARFEGMARAVEDILAETGRKALIVAGVDFAHVGRKFGHAETGASLLGPARKNDEELLAALERTEGPAIFENARRTRDRFNTCGLPALILLSRLLRGCRGTRLAHETYDEKATESAVTYASMIFHP